jgi:hypothetical protein
MLDAFTRQASEGADFDLPELTPVYARAGDHDQAQ